MSEDESTYERTRMMNRYLYGSSQPTLDATNEDPNSNSSSSPNSEQQQNTNGFSTSKSTTHANNITTPSSDEQRFRSKSHEASSRGLRPGILRVRNKEIERGVRIRNINSMVHSQQDRIVNEKKELNELNHRLDDLVESLKLKKAQNDELQQRLTKMREGIMYGEDEESKYKKAYDQELEKAKRDLNSVSEMSTLSKIRASRSMYDLDRVREMFDDEVRYQNATQEKIRMLENQRAESLHELNYLKENFESKNKSLLDDADRNAKLQQQLNSLSDQLDQEQESRVDVECRIQTLLEQKKFDLELYATMRDELERMFLYKGANSIPDPKTFYINELRELKDKIREDFKKQSEFNMETLREEYEYKSTTQIEEIETARRKEREISQEEQLTQAQLNQERQANFEELKRLKETECELTNRLNELSAKLGNYRTNVNFECESRENELWILREQIGNLKNDLSNMLSSSKSLDSEVAVYARLLNQKMNHTVSTTISLQEYENLVFTKHETKVIGTDERERRRNQEQAELKRRQSELEENNRRLKEIEEQRRRQRELEEQRRMKEIEEQHRRQCELLEQQRRQRELEEQRRALELEEQQRRQREFDEQQRRQREIEEQERRLKELEEQRRLREFEEQQRRQRELEEQQRKLREIEEQRRIKECEEQQRRQRECEEQQRRQRDLEEQQRKLRELEEQQRLQREQEERDRETKRQREYEEVQRRQREVEERQRVQREIEEEINRQARQRQHQQVQQCVQQQQQQQIVQQQQQQIVQQQTKIEEHHHHQVIIKKEQRCVNKTTTIAANNDFDAQQKQYIEQQRQQQICQQNKEQMEIERQRRLKMEREEHERYILEKLRQEQELYEIQQRKKIIQEQQEKEKRCQQQQQQQHQVQIYRNECKIEPTKVAPVVDVQCVDNIQLYTKRIIEENRKSTEIYEERRVTSSTTNNNGCHHWSTSTSSSNAVPVVPKGVSVIETSQNQARTQSQSEIGGGFSTSSIVDHHLATNNNQKHVIIVNTQKQPNTSSVDCHQQQHHQKSSNNGNQVMRTTVVKTPKNTNNTAVVGAADSAFSNKYAIKHKANRYVSGAIGILETSLNGEYIILENLSSNKVVNLKCWYIHKYVPDQGINVIYKFTDDIHLASGEKLKILARSAQRPHQRSSSVHEGLNKFSTACPNEKILVAHNVENWGTYSKYSVTKLINPDGVDKAVLTQSLLRLASSQSNVTGPAGAVTTVVPPPPPPPPAVDEATQQFINLQHHQQQNADAQRRLKINSKSTTNLNMRNSMHNLVEVDETSCHSAAAAPATHYRISTVAGIQNNQPVLSTTTSTKAGTVSTSTAQESSAASSSSMTTTHQHHHHHHHGNNGFKSQVITSSSTTPRVINNPAAVQSNLTRQF